MSKVAGGILEVPLSPSKSRKTRPPAGVGSRRGGYLRTSLLVNRTFNLGLAVVLLVFAFPVMALIYVLILLRDGRPGMYRGTRLGIHRDPFTMYKFRTLVPDAESMIGAELLTSKHRLMTPFGRFLRDTRLDELPQLLNIIRGDMDFVGPRPERPIIYEKIGRHIKNYDRRFAVKPGLVGYAQLFTPHSTPKRIRTMIDNTLVRKKQVLLWDAGMVFFTMAVILRTVLVQLGRAVHRHLWQVGVQRRFAEKREQERISPRDAWVLYSQNDPKVDRVNGKSALLVDINEQAFLMRTEERTLTPFPRYFKLETLSAVSGHGHRHLKKTALCEGRLYREVDRGGTLRDYVVEYTPRSPLNYYKVYQYFLARSVV